MFKYMGQSIVSFLKMVLASAFAQLQISREVWFDADCLTIERSLAEEFRESSNQQS